MRSRNASFRSSTRRSVVVVTFMLALSAGCGRQGKEAPQGGSDIPPSKMNLKRNVELCQAFQRTLIYSVETVGVLEAEGQTDIAAGVSGVVDEVLFREGDLVDSQTILVKVDQKRYLAAARVAEANLQRAEASQKMIKDIADRAQRAGQGASTEEKAKAQLNLGVAEADVQAAKATFELAKHNLDRSQVRVPYPGRINQRRVTPGSYVEDKTPLATIANLTMIRLVGYVPETAAPIARKLMEERPRRLAAVKVAVPVGSLLAGPYPFPTLGAIALAQREQLPSGFDPEFDLLVYPQLKFFAQMFYMSTVANPDTHMFEFKAEVDARYLRTELRPGYTARVRLPLQSNTAACVVPEESVRASEQGFIAFAPQSRVMPDGSVDWYVRRVPLELGYRSPGWVEVRKGLVPGQWIVRRGAEALEDGTPIQLPEHGPRP